MRLWRRRTTMAVLAVATAGVLLGASQGTQTDPLVTKSYLDSVAPKILAEVDAKLNQRELALMERFNAAIAKYTQEMDAKLGGAPIGGGGATAPTASSAFAVVTVAAGKQLVGGVGCEFLLRGGSATAVAASAPGLIDTTSGGTLASGGGLETNHLYLSTADGRGLKATTAVTVMVRGSYTIQ